MQDELLSALDAIAPAEVNYTEWLHVGMALKDAGCGWEIWDAWSQRDPQRHHKGECEKKWAGFRGSAHPVTQNTIFKMARARGWQGAPGRALDWDDEISAQSAYTQAGRDSTQADTPGGSSGTQPGHGGGQAFAPPGTADASASPPAPPPPALPLPAPPEPWDPAGQLITYLKALFAPSEHVGYVTKSWQRGGEYLPQKGCWDRTAGQLIEALSACGDIGEVLGDCGPAAGAWIRFNPLDGKGCKDENVTDCRYVLVESDKVDLETQYAVIRRLELPCAALVHSGNKSLHAIVRVDAPNYEEYRRRVDYLYTVCQQNGLAPDTQCSNPSRLSRMPGVERGGRKQYLLATNTGKASWAEWREWIESADDGLPPTEPLADIWAHLPPLAPPLIEGVLRQGHKLLLAGPSKAGKSYALIELCISIAEGVPWLGRWTCAQGRVLYVNLELDRASCLHRFADVYGALEIEPKGLRCIDIWNLRGASVPMDKLAPRLIRRAMHKGYTAIIIDPIYKVITGDENAADQMARFCNQFDRVCRALGCALIYCHHHSKGYQGGKRSMDRASGSGVFARDPDALLDLIELTPTEAIRDQLTVRAACGACCAALDARGLSDAYGPDEAFSRVQMLNLCKEHLGAADLRALDTAIDAAVRKAQKRTAWRIEGTLREFERFEPVNLWFDYPVHQLDDGLLEDLVPDADARATGYAGAQQRWKHDTPAQRKEKSAKQLESAFEACTIDGEVTVEAIAQYMNLTSRTVKERLRKDGRFWVDGEKVGLKEPGCKG